MAEEMKTRGAADVFKWSLFMAADVIGELTFGESFRMLELGMVGLVAIIAVPEVDLLILIPRPEEPVYRRPRKRRSHGGLTSGLPMACTYIIYRPHSRPQAGCRSYPKLPPIRHTVAPATPTLGGSRPIQHEADFVH